MDAARGATVGGTGVTAFLVVAVLVTEAASAAIEFSVFLGIPAGLVGAVVAMVVGARVLRRSPSRGSVAGITAVAAVGYAVLAGFALRYAVSATRDVLSISVIGGLALVVGVAVGVVGWLRRS